MLARAGVESKNSTSVLENYSDGDDGVLKGNGEVDSEDELYKQVKQQRAAELAAKAEIYSRYVSITKFNLSSVLYHMLLYDFF